MAVWRRRCQGIGLYRDVWIAAIASSRTSLATLTGVMCNTSQCELRSLRVNSGMLNVIRIVTYLLHITPVKSRQTRSGLKWRFAINAYEVYEQNRSDGTDESRTSNV